MYDINRYPCLRLRMKLRKEPRLRLIVLLRQRPLKRLVVFIRHRFPFLTLKIWDDPRRVLKNFAAYTDRQITYGTDQCSQFYTARDWHKTEWGYQTPPAEALQHFISGSNGAKEFARRYTYWPQSRLLKFLTRVNSRFSARRQRFS